MKNLIVGYGYCGRYLANELIKKKNEVICWSRTKPKQENIIHKLIDISKDDFIISDYYENIFYLIPPPRLGQKDTLLECFISRLKTKPKNFIYFGSSGIYGNHGGKWVDEESQLHLIFDRQHRRLNAENQLKIFCENNHINLACLRIAGIYGPGRIPLNKIMQSKPIIRQDQAPYSNSIFVTDLVNLAYSITHKMHGINIYNVSDNHPNKMGFLQFLLAKKLSLESPIQISLQEYYDQATPMAREFLSSSKKISSNKIQKLTQKYFTPLSSGLDLSLAET